MALFCLATLLPVTLLALGRHRLPQLTSGVLLCLRFGGLGR
jgi:hypothetical protein